MTGCVLKSDSRMRYADIELLVCKDELEKNVLLRSKHGMIDNIEDIKAKKKKRNSHR